MSAGMVGVPLSVCLLFGTLLQAGARGSPGERLDGGCPVGAPRVTEQILRSHLVEVPPPDYVGSGSAAVEIQVDEGGNVCYASLVFADAGLGESAVAWAKRLRFSPFLLAGFPTQVTATLPLRFGEKQAVSHGLQRQKDDLCGNGNLCLYLKPDGTLLKDGEMVSGAALGFALDHIDGHVIVRPDPRPEDDEPETELDDAVLSHSRAVVSPPPYPAPARVLLRLQLAR